jgi:short-subunit dehydrogenase
MMSKQRGFTMRMNVKGKVAVLTGAASGIGAALALALATKGADLALIDRDEAGLAAIATQARLFGGRVSTHIADLVDPAAIAALPAAIGAVHSGPTLLINNAGVALVGSFELMDEAEFAWLMDINFWAAVRLTRAFLPILQNSATQTEPKRLVFLSSVFGLVGPPWQTAYAASKFAIRGFGESLRQELAGTNLGVTIVHPGGIRTNIARAARVVARMDPATAAAGVKAFEAALTTSPETAARVIIDGVERGKARVLIGTDAYAIDTLSRLAPVRAWSLIERRLGKPERMINSDRKR